MSFHSASDYAGISLGEYEFYYGYEATIPSLEEDPDEDIEREWAFTCSDSDGEEIIRVTPKALGVDKPDDWPMNILLECVVKVFSYPDRFHITYSPKRS